MMIFFGFRGPLVGIWAIQKKQSIGLERMLLTIRMMWFDDEADCFDKLDRFGNNMCIG